MINCCNAMHSAVPLRSCSGLNAMLSCQAVAIASTSQFNLQASCSIESVSAVATAVMAMQLCLSCIVLCFNSHNQANMCYVQWKPGGHYLAWARLMALAMKASYTSACTKRREAAVQNWPALAKAAWCEAATACIGMTGYSAVVGVFSC